MWAPSSFKVLLIRCDVLWVLMLLFFFDIVLGVMLFKLYNFVVILMTVLISLLHLSSICTLLFNQIMWFVNANINK